MGTMTVGQNGKPATADEVCQDMCERITSLKLEPGLRIDEKQMSEEYGVSQSVCQKVFIRLSGMELLESCPRKGMRISRINLKLTADILLMRASVEKEALFEIFETLDMEQRQRVADKLKANLDQQRQYLHSNTYEPEFKRLDSCFHDLLIDSVGCGSLMQLIEDHRIYLERWRNFDVVFERKVHELVRQHGTIYRAVCDNDLITALRAMSDHLDTVSKTSQRAIAVYPHYFV